MVVFGPRLREATVLSGKLSGSRTLAGQLRRALFVACVLTVLCSLAPALSSAAQVTLAWDANTEPDLAGYKLYYGNSSGSYQFSVDVGNVTSYTRSGLLDGRIYYFAATTYNLSLAESGFSNEVSKAIADVTPPLVSITAPAAGVTVAGTVTVSANASDNVGVVGLQFKLDGFNLGAEDTVAPYSVSWNTTLATSGSHSLTAVARDAAGNTATSAAVSVTVDNTPPLISTVSASSISSTGAIITWATNEASDSQVDYGLTTAYDNSTPLNSSLLTAHAVTLTGLLATTTYHYRVKSRDAAGNLATSADFTLTTLIDTTPPTVSMTAPAAGSTVSGTVTISASATDNMGVVGVQFKLDGANLGAEVTAAPYSTSWNTTLAANGSHTLTAVARDAAGNSTTSAGVSVTVSNAVPDITPPSVPTNLSASAVSSSQITLSWTASTDNVGVAGYQIYRGGSQIATTSLTSYADTGLSPATTYVYQVSAYDAAGNVSALSASASAATLPPPPADISSGLGLYYRFDEGAGSLANDSSGNGNTGSLLSGTTWTAGQLGQAVNFDGVSGNVTASTTTGLNQSTTLTIAAWINPSDVSATYRTLVAKGAAGLRGYAVDLYNGKLNFIKVTGADVTSSVLLSTGTWQHVAITWNAATSEVKFYMNGALAQTISDSFVPPAPLDTDNLLVSLWLRGGSYFAGAMDELRIYNRVLSATDILALYNITPPTVSITAPSAGATVSGTVTVSATATDNVGVVGVQFKLDDANLGAEVMSAPYALSWNTATASNGTHTLTAVARDAAGNTATAAAVSVTVGSAPTITSFTPTSGPVGTSITISGTNFMGATAVTFNGVSGAPFTVTSATAIQDTVPAGATTGPLSVTTPGGTATSTSVFTITSTTPDTTPPTVSITAPANGATVSGSVTVSANATDNVGVVGVQFMLDGANLGAEVIVAPYAVSWDTTTAVNGSHTLTAVARASAGDPAPAAAISVTVNNVGPSTLSQYFKFDEASGTTATESSGNSNNRVLFNRPVFTAGRMGNALSLNGVNQYVQVSPTSGLNLSNAITLAAWVNPTDLSSYRNVVNKGLAGSRGFGMNIISGALNFVKVSIVDVTSNVILSTNAWQHIAITWNAATSEVKFYKNGTLAQTIINSSSVIAPTDTDVLLVGPWLRGVYYFAGLIDDLRIYNGVLAASDILAPYNAAPPYSSL